MLRSLDVIIKSLKDQIYGRSQSSSKSNLFSLSDDCLAYLVSFFDIDSLVNVDTAVTNVQERLLWLKFLSNSNTIVAYGSCPSSVRWLLRRGIIVRHIQIRDQKNHEITGRFFLELDMPIIQSVEFQGCLNLRDFQVSADSTIEYPELRIIKFINCEKKWIKIISNAIEDFVGYNLFPFSLPQEYFLAAY